MSMQVVALGPSSSSTLSLPNPPVSFLDTMGVWSDYLIQNMNLLRQMIGVSRILVNVKWLIKGEFRYDTPLGMASGFIHCISDFGSIIPLLDHWKAIDTAKIAATIGEKVSFLKPLMEVPIGSVLSIIASVAYVCTAADSIYQLTQPEVTVPRSRQAILDIVNAIFQITLSMLLVAGVTKATVILPLGFFCLCLGSACFLHRTTLPPLPLPHVQGAIASTEEEKEEAEKLKRA